MKKYVTYMNRIEVDVEEVEKETDKTVTINGRRNNKRSDWKNYHDSFDDAKQFLIDVARKKVDMRAIKLEVAKEELENLNYINNPEIQN